MLADLFLIRQGLGRDVRVRVWLEYYEMGIIEMESLNRH